MNFYRDFDWFASILQFRWEERRRGEGVWYWLLVALQYQSRQWALFSGWLYIVLRYQSKICILPLYIYWLHIVYRGIQGISKQYSHIDYTRIIRRCQLRYAFSHFLLLLFFFFFFLSNPFADNCPRSMIGNRIDHSESSTRFDSQQDRRISIIYRKRIDQEIIKNFTYARAKRFPFNRSLWYLNVFVSSQTRNSPRGRWTELKYNFRENFR